MAYDPSGSNDEPSVDWPAGFERTPPEERVPYPHGFRVARQRAFENILTQLARLDTENVKIDTEVEHQKENPNIPYASATANTPAVVVRYTKDGEQYVVPCDKWDNLRDNAQAIAKYLDAKRALDRYGVETIGDEFITQIESRETLIDRVSEATEVYPESSDFQYCPSCGDSLTDYTDVRYCPHCGHDMG